MWSFDLEGELSIFLLLKCFHSRKQWMQFIFPRLDVSFKGFVVLYREQLYLPPLSLTTVSVIPLR